MTEANAVESVSFWSDEPPATIDFLGVEEVGLLALHIGEAAIAIEFGGLR